MASDEETRHGVNAWKRGRLIRAGADIIIGDYRQQDELLALLGLSGVLGETFSNPSVRSPVISLDSLESVLAALPGLSIGLVGDLFLDRYLEIDPQMHELSDRDGARGLPDHPRPQQPRCVGTVMNNLARSAWGG